MPGGAAERNGCSSPGKVSVMTASWLTRLPRGTVFGATCSAVCTGSSSRAPSPLRAEVPAGAKHGGGTFAPLRGAGLPPRSTSLP